MNQLQPDNLVTELSILGRNAQLSLTARQRVRDQLFKKIGQLDLVDAVQTNTEVPGLIMPLAALLSIFKPRRVSFGLAATSGIAMGVAALTFATGALASNAEPGSGVFYSVRRALEDVQVALVADPVQKATKRIDIASNRLATATSTITANPQADAKSVEPVIEASKQAVAQAKAAIDAASEHDEATENLTARLQATLELQRDQLGKLSEEVAGNKEVASGIAAVSSELDSILASLDPETKPEVVTNKPQTDPGDSTAATIEPDTTSTPAAGSDGSITLVPNSFEGFLVLLNGSYAIVTPADNKAYPLIMSDDQDLMAYLGNGRASVYGPLTTQGILVRQLFIDSKLVWEDPSKINNNLPWVEGDQNNHLVND